MKTKEENIMEVKKEEKIEGVKRKGGITETEEDEGTKDKVSKKRKKRLMK